MRTQIIPAQITTVEDKIAGNLTLTQIVLMMLPVMFVTILYSLLPPVMILNLYKIAISLIFTVISLFLSIRYKGKIILSWLLVIAKFNLRPKYYVFNKNSIDNRKIVKEKVIKKSKSIKETKANNLEFTQYPKVKDLLQLDNIIAREKLNLSYKVGKKGSLHVAFEQISN